MDQKFEMQLQQILAEGQIRYQEPLKAHTTFRIGGPAKYFVMPATPEEVAAIVALCNKEKMPMYALGNGSNILASDEGYAGLILQIGEQMSHFSVLEQTAETSLVEVGAGLLLSKFAKELADLDLAGMAFAGGIPGTVGGAVVMNAGAYGGEIKDCIVDVTVVWPDGKISVLTKAELALGYRTSALQTNGAIVVSARFLLQAGKKEEILNEMRQYNQQRRDKQPLEYPSAGSTFKRPEGHFAGKLIQDAGLKGFRIGDMMVSEKHSGFVVNVGEGTAKDAHALLEAVSQKVWEEFQVKLEPEVKFL
ncbi:MAG: UDP-N-acetylmuramate dehydrogenase [Lachnospiraceae bacterium]|nr:UDP-N-acetylmuramate dehydrogenase [Lachnospiraceae bacterium]